METAGPVKRTTDHDDDDEDDDAIGDNDDEDDDEGRLELTASPQPLQMTIKR